MSLLLAKARATHTYSDERLLRKWYLFTTEPVTISAINNLNTFELIRVLMT
jgi:hypothetical protein